MSSYSTAIIAALLYVSILPMTAIALNTEIFRTTTGIKNTLLAERSDQVSSNLIGGAMTTGCYQIAVQLGTDTYNLLLDSGSSNLILPGTGVNAYTGPVYNTVGKSSIDGKSYSGSFTGGSTWSGKIYQDNFTVSGVRIKSSFVALTSQSSSVPVVNSQRQGILGLAYPGLAIHTPLLSTMSSNGVIKGKVVAFRGCPEWSSKTSVVNWGATNQSLTCSVNGVPEIWAKVIKSNTNYNFEIVSVDFNSTNMGAWSNTAGANFLDSCTTQTFLPTAMFNKVVAAINATGILQKHFDASSISNLLKPGGYVFLGWPNPVSIDYRSLPPLSFTLLGTDNSNVIVNFGSAGYFQQDQYGYVNFMLASTTQTKITLGTTFFEQFYIVLDQEDHRVGFGLGCTCNENGSVPYTSSLSLCRSSQVRVNQHPSKFKC
jgi:hypothetical protein